ncbi:MAG: adenosylmethionine decarboxylase [Gammaproteobacteria bacterium]|nr:adenosylmethionine decarboxylase [Gammaproteobacteria bacterium]
MELGDSKIKLHGFNNLTKTLSFNFYDICYALTPEHQQEYLEYVDEEYNAARLEAVLIEVTKRIGASILNMSVYDYEPRGASVACLISEEPTLAEAIFSEEDTPFEEAQKISKQSAVAHLDKSHVTAHTYPEYHPDNGISTFRVDIDVSTCGRVSPLKALDYLVDSFDEDIVILDYRVRGFTRDVDGLKHYIDHEITTIQDFLSEKTKNQYQMIDMNVDQENIFHTKMLLNDFKLDNYLFGKGVNELDLKEQEKIEEQLKKEMSEIFYGINSLD